MIKPIPIEPKTLIRSTYPKNPVDGDLLVWNSINAPSIFHLYAVNDVDEAKRTIRILIALQMKDEGITDNAFGLLMFETSAAIHGEWVEWEDPDAYEDIHWIMKEDEAFGRD